MKLKVGVTMEMEKTSELKVYLNQITGIDDALVSLLMSKRSYTREREILIRQMVKEELTSQGFLINHSGTLSKELEKLFKYREHTTLFRFIDLSFVVEGLHRGGQDDFDSHAKRLDNRIVRSSTRLANFHEGEKSEWYQDKILYTDEVLKLLGKSLPNDIEIEGVRYVKTDFGYIRADLQNNKDARRGLYPLAIPSNFIFKVQYPELAHIVQHRDNTTGANPELKQMIEMLKEEVTEAVPILGKHLTLMRMQNYKG